MFTKRHRITLLFNANKAYDRQVVEGVGEYLQASQSEWDIFIEEDFRARIDKIKDWLGDGVIADFDDKQIEQALADVDVPIVGVGGSYHLAESYPPVFGNWVLIYGQLGAPELGLTGAGLSTLASRVVMAVAMMVVFFSRRKYRAYAQGFLRGRINRADFRQLNLLGWPIALQMGMETSAFSLTSIIVGWIGTTALAAHQVMLTISQVGFMVYYGIGAAAAVRISNAMGQRDYRAARGFTIYRSRSISPIH